MLIRTSLRVPAVLWCRRRPISAHVMAAGAKGLRDTDEIITGVKQ